MAIFKFFMIFVFVSFLGYSAENVNTAEKAASVNESIDKCAYKQKAEMKKNECEKKCAEKPACTPKPCEKKVEKCKKCESTVCDKCHRCKKCQPVERPCESCK